MESHHTSSQPPILIPEVRIQSRIRELAQQINNDYQDEEVTAICVMKGTFIFFADLIRELEIPLTCQFLGLSSYGSATRSSGEVKVNLDLTEPLLDQNVLIVEDIIDSGLTMNFLLNMLRTRNPASIRVCSLLLKPDKLKIPLEVDYTGFKIKDEFVVGYGLDHDEKYRGLPYIGYIEEKH